MTPIRNPTSEAQERYNVSHVRTRNAVERCIGVWKGRWRAICKARKLPFTPQKCCRVIIATAVLHNIARSAGLPNDFELEEDGDDNGEDALLRIEDNRNGEQARRNLVNLKFTN